MAFYHTCHLGSQGRRRRNAEMAFGASRSVGWFLPGLLAMFAAPLPFFSLEQLYHLCNCPIFSGPLSPPGIQGIVIASLGLDVQGGHVRRSVTMLIGDGHQADSVGGEIEHPSIGAVDLGKLAVGPVDLHLGERPLPVKAGHRHGIIFIGVLAPGAVQPHGGYQPSRIIKGFMARAQMMIQSSVLLMPRGLQRKSPRAMLDGLKPAELQDNGIHPACSWPYGCGALWDMLRPDNRFIVQAPAWPKQKLHLDGCVSPRKVRRIHF